MTRGRPALGTDGSEVWTARERINGSLVSGGEGNGGECANVLEAKGSHRKP